MKIQMYELFETAALNMKFKVAELGKDGWIAEGPTMVLAQKFKPEEVCREIDCIYPLEDGSIAIILL